MVFILYIIAPVRVKKENCAAFRSWMSVVAVRKMLQDRAYLVLFVWFSESQIHDGGGTDYMFYSFTIFFYLLIHSSSWIGKTWLMWLLTYE